MSNGWVKIEQHTKYTPHIAAIVELGLPHSVAKKVTAKRIIPLSIWIPKWLKKVLDTYIDNESFHNMPFKEFASMVAGDYIDKTNNASTVIEVEPSESEP